ncbi:unnamed protein product [Symbiodinium microadriaticum]|nr:unnamed protein product [Symbiodinium microadriaticum]
MSSLEATEESFANQNRSSGSGAPDANPFEGGDQDGFVSLPVAYRYKLDGVRTRRYADGHSVQNLGTAWQAVALADTIDLDIENCCFTLLLQVLEKVEPQHESWPSVKETLRLCATQRKHVIENKLKLTLPEGKFERRFASRHTREQCLHTGAAASISFLSLGGCDIVERYGLAFFGATEGLLQELHLCDPRGQKVLLHLATDGNPHCVAMETLPGQEVCVTDVTVNYTFSLQHLSSMLSDATDRKYIILFYVNQKPDKFDNDAEDEEYRLLLETLAGGNENDYSGGADEEEGDVLVRDLIDDGFDGEQQQEDGDDESITHVGDELLALMKKEVTTFLRGPAEHIAKQGCQACPFCPFRQWPKGRVSRLVDHVRKYHSERKQFVASGTKQLKLVISLHDFDQTAGHPRANCLSRRAAMLRRTVDPPLQSNITVYAMHGRLVARFPADSASFLPRHPNHWWPLIEDVFKSHKVCDLAKQLLDETMRHQAFQVISLDATLRCCLPVLGQAHPRARKEDKEQAVFTGDNALTRVLTCRGRTNAVLALQALGQIQFMSVDNPSFKYLQEAGLVGKADLSLQTARAEPQRSRSVWSNSGIANCSTLLQAAEVGRPSYGRLLALAIPEWPVKRAREVQEPSYPPPNWAPKPKEDTPKPLGDSSDLNGGDATSVDGEGQRTEATSQYVADALAACVGES